MMLANLLQVSYQFVDSLWVSNLLGANALGAVSVSGTVIFTVLSFILGFNNAALTILSQQKGKQDETGLKRYLNAFVVLMSLLALALGTIRLLPRRNDPGVDGHAAALMPEATVYLQINFAGVLFVFGYNFISTVLRALGDSRTPLSFVFAAVVLNAVLDPLLIAGFRSRHPRRRLSATVVSQSLAFFYGLIVILRRQLGALYRAASAQAFRDQIDLSPRHSSGPADDGHLRGIDGDHECCQQLRRRVWWQDTVRPSGSTAS